MFYLFNSILAAFLGTLARVSVLCITYSFFFNSGLKYTPFIHLTYETALYTVLQTPLILKNFIIVCITFPTTFNKPLTFFIGAYYLFFYFILFIFFIAAFKFVEIYLPYLLIKLAGTSPAPWAYFRNVIFINRLAISFIISKDILYRHKKKPFQIYFFFWLLTAPFCSLLNESARDINWKRLPKLTKKDGLRQLRLLGSDDTVLHFQ